MVSAAADRRSTAPSTQQLLSMKGAGGRCLPDLIEQFNLTSDEAERIYNELLDLEQKAKSEETEA